ncbi:hypothetical protein Tco_0489589 [Tanacetum coccineum]
MTTPITTSTIDSEMHNNIMAAGSRDRPPMLTTGRYAQWQSRFLRYIDTRTNGDALRKFILEGPYEPTTVTIPVVPATNDTPAVPEQTTVETILTMLQQGESLNIQDVKTNLFWEFGKFISHDGESMESYYSRFYKMMNEMIRNNLTVATMQYQKEVNEIRAERIAKNANTLTLIVAASPHPHPYYQAPKQRDSQPITPLSESASKEDSDPEQAQRDKDINKNVDTSLRYKNDNQTGQFRNQRTVIVAGLGRLKPKRVKDYTYHKEKMLLCKQTKKGVPLQAEQAGWLKDMDEEIDEQELESHYSFMAKIQEDLPPESNSIAKPLE